MLAQCPGDEVYDKCSIICPPQVCGVDLSKVNCQLFGILPCIPGCRCKDGYLRNENKVCVPINECRK